MVYNQSFYSFFVCVCVCVPTKYLHNKMLCNSYLTSQAKSEEEEEEEEDPPLKRGGIGHIYIIPTIHIHIHIHI